MSVSLNPPGNYFDGGANFFVASTNINDLEYRATFTSVDIAATDSGTAHYPRETAVVEDAADLLSTLPLRVVTTRHLPIAAYGPVDRRRINVAREKWSSVSFASDKSAIQFHEELTKDVLALRNAWRRANTKITYPDTVSDEALRYRPPDQRFELGWEMFDAKKHIDVETLDRVAQQKANATRAYEYWHSDARDGSSSPSRGASSVRRSDSERMSRSSTSPLQGAKAMQLSPRSGSAGSTSPVPELALDVDVHRLVTDEQILQLFHPDEVATEIEKLQWDFQAFRPPADWKRKHDRRMNALTRKAAEWRPLELKRQPVETPTVASRVTSMPALAPFFTSGVVTIDPKLPVPAAMHGSGVSREVLESHGAHLASAFVVRPEVTQVSRPHGGGKAAPAVVEGASWGDLQRQIAAAAQSKS